MKHEAEWKQFQAETLEKWRAMSYDELARMVNTSQTSEGVGAFGTRYQVEVQVLWDDRRGGDLRVMCSIDDGGLSAFAPKTADFIIAPDGKFIGE